MGEKKKSAFHFEAGCDTQVCVTQIWRSWSSASWNCVHTSKHSICCSTCGASGKGPTGAEGVVSPDEGVLTALHVGDVSQPSQVPWCELAHWVRGIFLEHKMYFLSCLACYRQKRTFICAMPNNILNWVAFYSSLAAFTIMKVTVKKPTQEKNLDNSMFQKFNLHQVMLLIQR